MVLRSERKRHTSHYDQQTQRKASYYGLKAHGHVPPFTRNAAKSAHISEIGFPLNAFLPMPTYGKQEREQTGK
jgi:hypothetical protein